MRQAEQTGRELMGVTLELSSGKAGDSWIFFLCSITGSALSKYSQETFAYGKSIVL